MAIVVLFMNVFRKSTCYTYCTYTYLLFIVLVPRSRSSGKRDDQEVFCYRLVYSELNDNPEIPGDLVVHAIEVGWFFFICGFDGDDVDSGLSESDRCACACLYPRP